MPGLALKVREKPVVFVDKLVLLKEGFEILELFIVFNVESEGERRVNLTYVNFSHYVRVIAKVTMLKNVVIRGCAGERIGHLVRIE